MDSSQIKRHIKAVKKLETIYKRTLRFIKKNLGKVSEYDVSRFILQEFEKESLKIGKKHPLPIVAVEENTSFVHYFPKKNSRIIEKNNLILIDLWARLKERNSPFADLTWMAYSGKKIPKRIENAFRAIVKARETALSFIKNQLKKKRYPEAKEVDRRVRNCLKKFNLEKFFLHNTGHSLGFNDCHGRYFNFSQKSKEKLKPSIPFTIEPGVYFKNEFGVRSEINCLVKEYKLIMTSKLQRKIIKL